MTVQNHKIYTPDFPGVKFEAAEAFAKSLYEHIAFVREAGNKLGVDTVQLALHDNSKWGIFEFPGYANHFKGGGAPDEFAKAWLHHIHENPHHWQYWMFPDNYVPKDSQVENGIVEMPENFALEMIADWMGANKAYQGSWDMSKWLHKNFSKVKLHSKTKNFVAGKLREIGYSFIDQL